MKESESEIYDENYHQLSSNLTKEEIKEKILHIFYFLKEEDKFNQFYGNLLDITEDNKKKIIKLWDKLIKYLLEEIFHCFAFKISDIIIYLKINDKVPKYLSNILQILRIYQIYITNEDLNNDNYYSMNFLDLYPPTKSFFKNVMYYIPFGQKTTTCCRDEEDKQTKELEDNSIRKDLSEDEKQKNIPENSIIFNYEIFKIHCNSLLMVLKDILHENDSKIIKKETFINNIKDNYIENDDNSQDGRYKLRYGLQYIQYAIHYLEKMKKILIFKINLNVNIEFIKVSKDKDDMILEDDKEEAKLILSKENN